MTIRLLERESPFSLAPVIVVRDLRVSQPAWAGPGDLALVRLLRVRVHLLPLLFGRSEIEPLVVSGSRLRLMRAADGRENWRVGRKGTGRGESLDLAAISVQDTSILYEDALQHRRVDVQIRIVPEFGLHAKGQGSIDGAPVQVMATGARFIADRPWPFQAHVSGKTLDVQVSGTMQHPLAVQEMRFHVAARADDLKRLDRIIEAGLFSTQPVALTADVERSPNRWIARELKGTVGNSRLAGALTVRKLDGRTKVDGRVHFSRLNFDDLASNAGIAKSTAIERAYGPRLVPDTRINIRKLRDVDGRIAVDIDQVIGGRGPSLIKTAEAVFALEDRVLTVSPLRLGLESGAIVGKATVDQRNDSPKPKVTFRLDLTNSTLAAIAGNDVSDVTAKLAGRLRLIGVGDTIREAVGASAGTIGIAARTGALPNNLAGLIGFDLGKGLLGSRDKRVGLRCAVLRLKVRGGQGDVETLVIDTDISQSIGRGSISFPTEVLDLTLTGAPKRDALLRLDGPVRVGGFIQGPRIMIPPNLKSAGTILHSLAHSLFDNHASRAEDADCAGLIKRTRSSTH